MLGNVKCVSSMYLYIPLKVKLCLIPDPGRVSQAFHQKPSVGAVFTVGTTIQEPYVIVT